MKITALRQLVGFFLLVTIGSSRIAAAAPFSIPADLDNAEVRLAATYVAAHPSDLTELDALLNAKGSTSVDLHAGVRHFATIMQGIVQRKEADFDSEIFWELFTDDAKIASKASAPLASGIRAVPSRTAPSATASAQPSPVPATPLPLASVAPVTAEPVAPSGKTGIAAPKAVDDAPASTPVVAKADLAMQKTALRFYADYSRSLGNAKISDEAFNKVLADFETGPFRTALAQVHALSKDAGAKPGSDALALLLAGNVAAQPGNSLTTATALPKPVAEEISGVIKDDQNEYDQLKTVQETLNTKIKSLLARKTAATGDAKLSAAIDLKLAEFTDGLNENLARQNLLLAKSAAAKADAAAKPGKELAEKSAEASLRALQDAIKKKYDAPEAKKQDFAELKVKEAAFDSDQKAQEEIKKGNTGATATAADAKSKMDQDNLDAIHVAQQKLRDLYAQDSAEAAQILYPADATAKADFEKAKSQASADTASDNALQKKLSASLTDPKRSPFAFTHTGLRMVAPYSIEDQLSDPADPKSTTGRKVLSSGKTQVGTFLEFAYTDVWAWRPGRRTKEPVDNFQYLWAGGFHDLLAKWQSPPTDKKKAAAKKKANVERTTHRMPAFENTWDTIGRVSFEFGQNDKPAASAITGSGDFGAEITFDKHIVRGSMPTDDQMVFSGNLSFSVAGFTDRSTFKVHPRILTGGSIALSFDDPWSSADTTPRKVWFRMQGGPALIDSLAFDEQFPNSRVIRTTHGDVPKYEHRHVLALETELFWPLRDYALISMGARLYGGSQPTPWSLYVGMTIPLTSLADSLSPK